MIIGLLVKYVFFVCKSNRNNYKQKLLYTDKAEIKFRIIYNDLAVYIFMDILSVKGYKRMEVIIMREEKITSLYNIISESVVDGQLPKDFALPKLTTDDSQIVWIDGAIDGVRIYHMGMSEVSDENRMLMINAVQAASRKEFDSAEELFCKLGQAVCAIAMIDELQSYIINHEEELIAENIYQYAVDTILNSMNRECVKYGLSLLELFDTSENEELRNIIRTIGLSEEFSLFAIFVMRQWKDGNNEIYQLAHKIHGWGRIHAIEHIQPETEEIKKWFLTDGVYNEVMSAYSALTCWQKSDAESVLKNKLTRDEFVGIRDIIDGLLDEGPVSGISEIENSDNIIITFLKQAKTFELDLDDYEVIYNIRVYFKSKSANNPEITFLCQEFLTSDNCKVLVKAAVKKGQAINLAQDLKLDFKEDILELLKSSFDSSYYLCNLLMPDLKYKDTVLELFQKNLPLHEMKTEPTNSLGLGQKYQNQNYLESILQGLKRYPLEGQELVETALQSSPVRTRNFGLKVLEAWVNEKKVPLKELIPEIYSLLCRLRDIEPNDNTKSAMDKLIEGNISFEDI